MPNDIAVNEPLPTLRTTSVTLTDNVGNPITGLDQTKVTIKTMQTGGSFATSAATLVENLSSVGGGSYDIVLPVAEIGIAGDLKIEITSGTSIITRKLGFVNIVQAFDISESGLATEADVTAVPAAVMGSALRSGRTVKGLFRRLDALFFGKATGLLGTLVTLFQPDGTTTEFTATQDPVGGTRSTIDVTTSES